jgi:hypothetical protein
MPRQLAVDWLLASDRKAFYLIQPPWHFYAFEYFWIFRDFALSLSIDAFTFSS